MVALDFVPDLLHLVTLLLVANGVAVIREILMAGKVLEEEKLDEQCSE